MKKQRKYKMVSTMKIVKFKCQHRCIKDIIKDRNYINSDCKDSKELKEIDLTDIMRRLKQRRCKEMNRHGYI